MLLLSPGKSSQWCIVTSYYQSPDVFLVVLGTKHRLITSRSLLKNIEFLVIVVEIFVNVVLFARVLIARIPSVVVVRTS